MGKWTGMWARFQCWRGNHEWRGFDKNSDAYGRGAECARCGHSYFISLVG